MSDWNQQRQIPDSRRTVALVAGAIIIAFILLFVIIVNVANSTGHKKLAASSAATTTTATDAVANGSAPGDGGANATTTITDPLPTEAPEGILAQPSQLAISHAESTSNLSAADWTMATTIANKFVTADSTGQGVDQFGYYYATKAINTPWIKDLNIQWVYATSEVQGTIHATVWYSGTSLVDGSTVNQATQDLWLDTAKNDQVIHPTDLINYGVDVNLNSCCINIR